MRNIFIRFTTAITRIGADPNDEEDIRLKKASLGFGSKQVDFVAENKMGEDRPFHENHVVGSGGETAIPQDILGQLFLTNVNHGKNLLSDVIYLICLAACNPINSHLLGNLCQIHQVGPK